MLTEGDPSAHHLPKELNAAPNADNWALARQAGVPIICHIVGDRSGNFEAMGKAALMGPDNEYIHCMQLNETHWKMIADTGGRVSIAPAIEMQMSSLIVAMSLRCAI